MEDADTRGLLAYFTRHRTAATFVMAVMVMLGLVAATQIRSQFFPDVVIDTVSVTVDWDGAGPEDLDASVVALLEPPLQAVDGVFSTTAVSVEGSATITLTLEPGWDLGRATGDVSAAVEAVRTLPEGTDEPVIERGIWRDKVAEIVVFGTIEPAQLGQIADEIVARLHREGITRTALTGLAAPQIDVLVPEVARVRHDLSLRDVADAIAAQASSRPAGDLADGSARLRAGDEQRTADEIRAIVIGTAPDGGQIAVRNVAQVVVTDVDAGRAYFMGEAPAMLIRVDRSAEGDSIAIQRAIEAIVAEVGPTLPEGVALRVINPRASEISRTLDIVYQNALMGLILVLGVLFLFLNVRTAIWVAMGIPVTMLAAVAVMYAGGVSLNIMSLFGLIIMLGIVVDDAIVIAEHADFRARILGEAPGIAPVRAVKRMIGPVFSSTATTILAFVALFFIGGSFGTLISDIPFVVAAVLTASLIESLLILPNHMRHALEGGSKKSWLNAPSDWFNHQFGRFADGVFAPFMALVIRARYAVVAGMILLLSLAAAAVIRGDVIWQFYTAPESGSIAGNFAFLPGATREDTRAMAREIDRAVAAVAARHADALGVDPVVHALTQVGGTGGRGLPGQSTMDQDLLGNIDIGLIGADERPFTAEQFVREVQQELRRPPGLALLSFRTQGRGPAEDSLAVNLYGEDSAVLKAAAEDLIATLSAFPEVTGLEDNLPYGRDETVLRLTPQGAALGLTEDGIGAELFARLRGITAAEFPAGTRTTEVTVRLPEAEQTADFLAATLIRVAPGQFVPLGEVVTAETLRAFSTITRENGRRLVTVTGDLSEDNPARAAEIGTLLQDELLPELATRYNLDWDLSGLAVQESSFLTDAFYGFLLCVIGIYLILGWILGSWTEPLIVVAVIPFGLIGTVLGHAQFDLAMSLFTVIGLIGMSGIIINDAIVLVTTVQDYARTRPIAAAAIDGARERLRPILLTTLTTVLGLAPLMYESSRQALFLKPTVVTLVYGLSVGFFVVLLVVPSLLVMRDDMGIALRSLRRLATGRATPIRWPLRGAVAALAVVNLAIFGPWAEGVVQSGLAGLSGLGAQVALSAVASLVIVLGAGLVIMRSMSRRPGRRAQ
jgi:multidrug efflux pump subunit AcrB